MGNYVFLGPPGAGKGTIAAMLCEEFDLAHISTGDILRREMRAESELGREARQYMADGTLVPDELVAAIVERTLAGESVKESGFVLDGYPRTLRQAQLLEESKARHDLSLQAAVLLEVRHEVLMQRLTARRVCAHCGKVYNVIFSPPARDGVCGACGGRLEQRDDDKPATIKQRLSVYDRQTAPVIQFYEQRNLLIRTDGEGAPGENYEALKDRLGLAP